MSRFVFALISLSALVPGVQADETELPRVLCITDAFQKAHVITPASRELKGKVEITLASMDGNDSGSALAAIEQILGEEPWDAIYFSFGIGDLFYKSPDSREIRAMSKFAGGVRVSSPKQYESNLSQLVPRLKQFSSHLIWGNTVPLVHGRTAKGEYRNFQENLFDAGSPGEYNEIADQVMKRHSIPVIDFHAHVAGQFTAEERLPAYTQYAKVLSSKEAPLHGPFVEAMMSMLKLQE